MKSYESESVTLDTFGFPGRFLASGLEYGQFWQGALKFGPKWTKLGHIFRVINKMTQNKGG